MAKVDKRLPPVTRTHGFPGSDLARRIDASHGSLGRAPPARALETPPEVLSATGGTVI